MQKYSQDIVNFTSLLRHFGGIEAHFSPGMR